MNEWEQQQPVDEMTTSPNDPNISLKHVGLLAGIIIVPLVIIGVILPFIPKQKAPQIRIADSVVLPSPTTSSISNTVAVAVLASVTGDVQVKKGEVWSTAVAEDEIAESDVIKTSFDSQATLLFDSGSIIRVDQNSQIALSEYSRDGDSWIIKINQIFGRSWNRVQKLIGGSIYEVNTPTAVATVRGTTFAIDADASGSAITVDEGEVVARIIETKQEVRIQKQETADISKKEAVVRKIEKLPEWVEKHKREVEREAPKIQEIKREIERKVEFRREERPIPTPTPFRPTPTPIKIETERLLPTPTPISKIETRTEIKTEDSTSTILRQ